MQQKLLRAASCSSACKPNFQRCISSRALLRNVSSFALKSCPRPSPRHLPGKSQATSKGDVPAPPNTSELASPSPSGRSAPASWAGLAPSGSTVMAAAAAGLFGFSVDGLSSSLQSIAVLALIIAVHEFGHFQAARLQGITVTKFAIGFGPAIWSKKDDDGIEYSLRLFPLGGYVAFPGEEKPRPENPNWTAEEKAEFAKQEEERVKYDPDDPNLLKNRSIWARGIVISAGVAANIVFAYLTLLMQITTVGKADPMYQPGVRIPEVNASSVAARAGFQSGDVVLEVGEYKVPGRAEQVSAVVNAIRASPGARLDFKVLRDGTVVEVPCVPEMDEGTGDGRIGVRLMSNIIINHIKPTSVDNALEITNSEFNRLSTSVLRGLNNIFSNFSQASQQLTGPVAIVAAGSDILRTDAAGIFQFCAIININLAAVNLLPLPGLDGGYLAFLMLEAIRGGKKVPEEVEGAVMTSGLLVLLGSGLFLAVRDTMNLVL